MGGRGGSGSAIAGPGVQQPVVQTTPQTAADAKDLNELAQHMAGVGIKVDVNSLAGQNFENVKAAANSIEWIVNEFPQAASAFNRLEGGDLGKGVFAHATYSGTIAIANHYYSKSADDFERSYARSVRSGYHPQGTESAHIASHEAGHVLNKALLYKVHTGRDLTARWNRANDWNKNTTAGKIIHEAVSVVKKTPAGKGLKTDQLIRQVSGYAAKNRAEALAECVADYAANGSNAKALSVAVWNILKRELG